MAHHCELYNNCTNLNYLLDDIKLSKLSPGIDLHVSACDKIFFFLCKL